jgi:centrosomal protein CEP76
LYLQILNGKAFLEYLTQSEEDTDVASLMGQNQSSYFLLYVHFRGQRFKSRAFACSCEPRINEGFLLELHKDRHGSDYVTQLMADSTTLLSIFDPIHIVMTRVDVNQEMHLISSQFLEWRSVLTAPNSKQNMTIEMMSTGSESKIPAGLLNVCLQIVPTLVDPLRDEALEYQLSVERSKNTERERLFLVYAKQWWREYLEIRDDHKNRLVKIFAQVIASFLFF